MSVILEVSPKVTLVAWAEVAVFDLVDVFVVSPCYVGLALVNELL